MPKMQPPVRQDRRVGSTLCKVSRVRKAGRAELATTKGAQVFRARCLAQVRRWKLWSSWSLLCYDPSRRRAHRVLEYGRLRTSPWKNEPSRASHRQPQTRSCRSSASRTHRRSAGRDQISDGTSRFRVGARYARADAGAERWVVSEVGI